MDFLANLVKRPISINLSESPPSNQISPAASPSSDAISLSSQQLGSDAPSPLIASAMNTSINTEMTDLLESAKEDLLRIEGRNNSKSPSKEVLEETTILKEDNTSKALKELMDQINENLNQVSEDDIDDDVQEIDPLNLHETPSHVECYQELSPMTTKSKQQQQPQSAALRASIQGETTVENKNVNAIGKNPKNLDANAGGDANSVVTVPKKLTGLTGFDESEIPELPLGSTAVLVDDQLKEDLLNSYSGGITTNQLSSTGIMPNKHLTAFIDSENEYNSDSDFFVECQSVHSDKCTTDPTLELDTYRSALNFQIEDATLDIDAPFVSGDNVVHQNEPFGIGNDTHSLHNVMNYEDEPMDVSMNSTLGLQNEMPTVVATQNVEPVALVSANEILLMAQNIPNDLSDVNIFPNSFTENERISREEEPSSETAVDTIVASADETKIEKKQTDAMNEIQSGKTAVIEAGNIEIFSLKDLRHQEDANKSNLTLDMTGSFGSNMATSTRLPSPNLQSISDKNCTVAIGSSIDKRVNLTLDMTSSFGSNKSVRSASPSFPIKHNKSPQAFPYSPHAPPDNEEMAYLESYDPTPSTATEQVFPKSIDIKVITTSSEKSDDEMPASQVKNDTMSVSVEQANAILNGTFNSGALTRSDSEKRRTFCIAPPFKEEQSIDSGLPDSIQNVTRTFTFPTSKFPELNSNSRRTFCIADTERSFTIDNDAAASEVEIVKNSRRTFSLPPRPEPMDCDEPMDVDQTLLLDDQNLVMSPPISTHKIKSGEQEIVVLKETDDSKSSAPLPILQNQANNKGHTQIEQPSSPPLASIRSTFNVPEQPSTSPPLASLRSTFNVPEQPSTSPPLASLRSTFNVPEQPPTLASNRSTFNVAEQPSNSPPSASLRSIINVPEQPSTSPPLTANRLTFDVPKQSPTLASNRSTFNVPEQPLSSPSSASIRSTFNVLEQPPRSPSLASIRSTFNAPEQRPPSPTLASNRSTYNIPEQPPSSPPLSVMRSTFNIPEQRPSSLPFSAIRSTFNVPEQPPYTVATSPPIPTLQKCINKDPEDVLTSTAASLPKANPQIANLMRASIHKTPVEDHKLSEKERAKSNSKDEKDVFVENFGSESGAAFDNIFAKPQSMSAFAKLKPAEKQNDTEDDQEKFFDVDENPHPNVIFNPSDFEYLLTKGNSNVQIDRSSLLLKFDPLLGVPVPSNQTSIAGVQQQQQQTQEQQQLLQILGYNNRYRSLSPTIEESEKSFSGLDQDQQQQEQQRLDTSPSLAPLEGLQRAKTGDTYILKPAVDRLKKHAKMSVDVIDNDCNKTFENSNSQSEEKQLTYNKMDELEKKLKNEVLKSSEDFEKKLKDAEQREEALIKRITEKDKTITKMAGVIEAYEKAIAELINEKEQIISNFERQLSETKADRDSNYHHLTSLETTFSDLHVKYEKSKEMTQQLKATEESLLNEKKQLLENLRLQEQRYEKMKSHAMQQLEIANKKLESVMKENAIEITKLRASLKKEEISRSSIQEQLQQKTIENAELVKICDELINGQGS